MLRKVKSIRFILLLIVIQCQRRGSSVKMKRSTLLDFNFNGGMVKFKEKASEIADSRLVQPLQEVKVGLHVTWLFDSVVEKDRGCGQCRPVESVPDLQQSSVEYSWKVCVSVSVLY